MRKFYLMLLFVVLFICVSLFAVNTRKDVVAATGYAQTYLDDTYEHEGIIVDYLAYSDSYVVYIKTDANIFSYPASDFVGYTPEEGGFVKVDTSLDKWNVYKTYSETESFYYSEGYDEGYLEGYYDGTQTQDAYDIGYDDGYSDGYIDGYYTWTNGG